MAPKKVIKYEVFPDDQPKLDTIRKALSTALGLDESIVNDAMIVAYALGAAFDQLTKKANPISDEVVR